MLKLLRAAGDLDRALFLDPLFIGRLFFEKVIFVSPLKGGRGERDITYKCLRGE
jgi:hypothetical protein